MDARMGGITEQLVRDMSSLQQRLRLKEIEAEALLQRCRDLEAERDSLKAAYDLTRACQAALSGSASEQSGSRMRPASYYVPLSLQVSRPEASRIPRARPSIVDWHSEFLRGLDEAAMRDILGHHSGNLGDLTHACRIQ